MKSSELFKVQQEQKLKYPVPETLWSLKYNIHKCRPQLNNIIQSKLLTFVKKKDENMIQ